MKIPITFSWNHTKQVISLDSNILGERPILAYRYYQQRIILYYILSSLPVYSIILPIQKNTIIQNNRSLFNYSSSSKIIHFYVPSMLYCWSSPSLALVIYFITQHRIAGVLRVEFLWFAEIIYSSHLLALWMLESKGSLASDWCFVTRL